MARACLVLFLAAMLLLTGCGTVGTPNDCVIVAARAQAELPPRAWSRLLVVGYADRPAMGHCYLVYEWPAGHLWAYDAAHGSRLIRPPTRAAAAVARAADPLAASGCYIEGAAAVAR